MHVSGHRQALRNADKIAYVWVSEQLASRPEVEVVKIRLAFDERGVRGIEPVTGLNLSIW
jgi:hypothetical protein